MGSLCAKKSQFLNENDTRIEEDGRLLKKLTSKEINFWITLRDLGFVKISEIKDKSILFNFSDLIYENFLPISTIMNELIFNENFFVFNDLLEILLGIIDFMQIVFYLKKKNDLTNFFMLNFNKFSLMREQGLNNNLFSKLVYLDHKLTDYYNKPEIIVKEDTNLFSSFSFATKEINFKSVNNLNRASNNLRKSNDQENNNTNNTQNLFSYIGNGNSENDSKIPSAKDEENLNESFSSGGENNLDMNSFFYSRCNDRYRKLKENFSLENCEFFYSECLIGFLLKFLLKKTIINESFLSKDFMNFKTKLKNTLYILLKKFPNKISLQKLKEILSNFYLNNFDYNNFLEKCEKLILNRESKYSGIFNKILSKENLGIRLMYGDCDILTNLSNHNICFVYDSQFKIEENSVINLSFSEKNENKNQLESMEKLKEEDFVGDFSYKSGKSLRKNSYNESVKDLKNNFDDESSKKSFIKNKAENSNLSIICLNCSKKIIMNNLPSNSDEMIKLIDYKKNFLEKKYENFAIDRVLNYFNYYFSFENFRKNDDNKNEEFNMFDNKLYLKEPDCFYLYKQNDFNIIFVYENGQKNIFKQINLDEFASKK